MKYFSIVLMLAGAYFIFFGGSDSVKPKKSKAKVAKTEQVEDYSDFLESEVEPKQKDEKATPKQVKLESNDSDFTSVDNSTKLKEIKSEAKPLEGASESLDSIPEIDAKENTINAAMVKVSELNAAYTKKINANINGPALALQRITNDYLKEFIRELGKAYLVAEGHDKLALKYLKEFEVSWEKRVARYYVKMEEMDKLISFNLKGDLNQLQSNNKYALTEMSKLTQGDTSYTNSANFSYTAAMKKFKIENENIKIYFFSYGKLLRRLLKPRLEMNNSAKVLIDKVYAFNSLVRQAIKGNKLNITRQSQADSLNDAVREINAARADYKNKLQTYNASN